MYSKPCVGRLNPKVPSKKKPGSMSSIVRGQKITPFLTGLPLEENFATLFWGMGVNMETACFFCSDFEESGAMQSIALFMNLARERLPVLIVTDRRGLWCGRLLTQSTTAG